MSAPGDSVSSDNEEDAEEPVATDDSTVARPIIGMTFDCAAPGALARFWSVALGYVESPPPTGWETWEAFLIAQNVPEDEWDDGASISDPAGTQPSISFLRVPEPKQAKNRLHLDLKVSGGRHVDSEVRARLINTKVAELVEAGGVIHQRQPDTGALDHIVMQDPEGNEFCVV